MAERIGGQEILVRLTIILVGTVLLIVPFSILPALGVDSASYGAFLVFVTGFLAVFFSLALWIRRSKKAELGPVTKRERLRFVLILAGIVLLVAPISTGRGLGPSAASGNFLAVIIGIGILVVIVPAQLRATKLHAFLEAHPRAALIVEGRRLYLTIIMVLMAFGLFITLFIPVRSEPAGWYYTDTSGCTQEYRLGTGPDPSPPQQSITGMYYNLWGLSMEHAYPSNYHYHVCTD